MSYGFAVITLPAIMVIKSFRYAVIGSHYVVGDRANKRKELLMAKEEIKQMTGVFASVFAHAGHITKEEAKEIAGLEGHEFEKAYGKAASISEKMMQAGGKKMD